MTYFTLADCSVVVAVLRHGAHLPRPVQPQRVVPDPSVRALHVGP